MSAADACGFFLCEYFCDNLPGAGAGITLENDKNAHGASLP